MIHIYATLVFSSTTGARDENFCNAYSFSFIEIWKIHVQCALIIMNIWESLERKLWLVISWRGGTNHYFHYSTLHCRHTHFCFLLYRDVYLDFEFLFGIVTLDTHRFSFLYIYIFLKLYISFKLGESYLILINNYPTCDDMH